MKGRLLLDFTSLLWVFHEWHLKEEGTELKCEFVRNPLISDSMWGSGCLALSRGLPAKSGAALSSSLAFEHLSPHRNGGNFDNFDIPVPLRCPHCGLQRGPFCSPGAFETKALLMIFSRQLLLALLSRLSLCHLSDSSCRRIKGVLFQPWAADLILAGADPELGWGSLKDCGGRSLAGRSHPGGASGIFSNPHSMRLEGSAPCLADRWAQMVKSWWWISKDGNWVLWGKILPCHVLKLYHVYVAVPIYFPAYICFNLMVPLLSVTVNKYQKSPHAAQIQKPWRRDRHDEIHPLLVCSQSTNYTIRSSLYNPSVLFASCLSRKLGFFPLMSPP